MTRKWVHNVELEMTAHDEPPPPELADKFTAIYEAAEVEAVLKAIIRCECEFSRDRLQHAHNAIEHMRKLAKQALSQEGRHKAGCFAFQGCTCFKQPPTPPREEE
jgi:hypothetical protein